MRTESHDAILVGRGDQIRVQPFDPLRRQLESLENTRSPRLAFMTESHHRVRDFAVTELPRLGRALPPDHIAEGTRLPLDRVDALLNDLEVHLFFLVRDGERRVSWAFPVTSEKTPHRLELSTGETIFAA
jgi:hypothetical protein